MIIMAVASMGRHQLFCILVHIMRWLMNEVAPRLLDLNESLQCMSHKQCCITAA